MLKKLFLGAIMIVSISAFAQQNQPSADTNPKDVSDNAQLISTAAQLVQYGYQTKSALPLIQAVQIFKSLNLSAATDGITPESDGSTMTSGSVAKKDVVSYDEKKLLADATTFADGNKNLLALIKDTEKATRGAVGGAIARHSCVRGGYTDTWTLQFRGQQQAYVCVNGDGDTDLDLYVYDANGNLITYDDDGVDLCVCRFTPRWTGTFRIKVVNRGRIANCYDIVTN